jgi:IS30 family transposase
MRRSSGVEFNLRKAERTGVIMEVTKNKHMTLADRMTIEAGLRQNLSFSQIAQDIGKHPTTVSKEVRLHVTVEESSVRRTDAMGEPIRNICKKLLHAPYVCNGCKHRHNCSFDRHFYWAKTAQKSYELLRREAREGIVLNKPEFYAMDEVLSKGIRSGQHIYHIVQTNDLPVSTASVYRYLDRGYLSVSSVELPRKLKFKTRRKPHEGYVPGKLRKDHTYQEFQAYITDRDISHWVEMDTVIGRVGGKVLLTLDFTFCNFMAALLLNNKTAGAAADAIRELKSRLSDHEIRFGDLIPLLLTDNGGEFSRIADFEDNANGEQETHLFFCDPMRSSQKAHVEKNHTLFRDICPKGTSFDDLTQDDINRIFSHVNSIARRQFAGKCPYDIFSFTYSKKIASLFGIQRIPDSEVNQSPKLLKQIRAKKTR